MSPTLWFKFQYFVGSKLKFSKLEDYTLRFTKTNTDFNISTEIQKNHLGTLGSYGFVESSVFRNIESISPEESMKRNLKKKTINITKTGDDFLMFPRLYEGYAMESFFSDVAYAQWGTGSAIGVCSMVQIFFPAVPTLRAFGAQALTVFNHF